MSNSKCTECSSKPSSAAAFLDATKGLGVGLSVTAILYSVILAEPVLIGVSVAALLLSGLPFVKEEMDFRARARVQSQMLTQMIEMHTRSRGL